MRFLLKSVVVSALLISTAARADVSLWDKIFGSPVGEQAQAGAAAAPAEGSAQTMLSPSDLGLDTNNASGPAAGGATALSEYKLGPGDEVSISVYNEKELSIDTHVSDAGTVSYPFMGTVQVQGMTVSQLKDYITQQLADGYLVNPQVYVSILSYRQFFVNGEVGKPGGYPYVPGLTVRKAIALAGGFTARASYTKIEVIHEQDALGMPRQASLNSFLLPGDIITVDQSFF